MFFISAFYEFLMFILLILLYAWFDYIMIFRDWSREFNQENPVTICSAESLAIKK